MLKENSCMNLAGIGLGLAICKDLCEALGGWINV